MKALTLTQPWATLVAICAKRIETRSWRTSYRGALAIHAAKGFPKEARMFTLEPVCYNAIKARYGGRDESQRVRGFPAYPLGMVIATCKLVDCLPVEATGCLPGVFDDYPELDNSQERAFGDYSEGRWGWVLEGITPLPQPVPAKGALSLWNWQP